MDALNIIKPTQRVNFLCNVSDPFDFSNPPFDPEAFAKALTDKMIAARGIGLAAIQVGQPYRIFSILTEPPLVLFNPKIVGVAGDLVTDEEGCLSFPGLYVKIKRYADVTARFQDHTGKFITRNFKNGAARVVQHELDHCDGILFYNRAARFHRDKALKHWEQALKRTRPLNTQKGVAV